jgi:hypothetical protein
LTSKLPCHSGRLFGNTILLKKRYSYPYWARHLMIVKLFFSENFNILSFLKLKRLLRARRSYMYQKQKRKKRKKKCWSLVFKWRARKKHTKVHLAPVKRHREHKLPPTLPTTIILTWQRLPFSFSMTKRPLKATSFQYQD